MDYSNHNKQKKGKRSAARWPFFLIGFSALLLIVSGVFLLKYYDSYRKEQELSGQLLELKEGIIGSTEADPAEPSGNGNVSGETGSEVVLSPEERSALLWDQMIQLNADYVGWIELKDSKLSYPIVARDNIFYLDHDFEGKSNKHGAIFLDENCKNGSGIWLIHGHHMKDGTMFAGLSELKDKKYLESHRNITIDMGAGEQNYRIYALALVDFTTDTAETPAFHYENLPVDEEALKVWKTQLINHSFWYDGQMQWPEDLLQTENTPNLLVLSTCEYGTEEQRLVVVAVKE